MPSIPPAPTPSADASRAVMQRTIEPSVLEFRRPVQLRPDDITLDAIVDDALRAWKLAADFLSSSHQMVELPEFDRLVSLGHVALRPIFADLGENGCAQQLLVSGVGTHCEQANDP